MSNLEKAKEIIKNNFNYAQYGLYNTRNTVGDCMVNIYSDNDFCIDICYDHSYFEVFGLSYTEFAELCNYYNELCLEEFK